MVERCIHIADVGGSNPSTVTNETDCWGKYFPRLTMEIRLATKNDYEQLMDLYNKFVGSDRYSRHDNDSFHETLLSSSNFIYVGVDGTSLIAFASFSIRKVVRYPKPIAELDELFVLEQYRRTGVGKQLLQQIEEKAILLDCYRLYIESHYDHKDAHRFYERLGYTNYGYHFIKNLTKKN